MAQVMKAKREENIPVLSGRLVNSYTLINLYKEAGLTKIKKTFKTRAKKFKRAKTYIFHAFGAMLQKSNAMGASANSAICAKKMCCTQLRE